MTTSLPPDDFVQDVRNALMHLYDYAYLQNHPLAAHLRARTDVDALTRAQMVRRRMLDCIEALKPEGRSEVQADDVRAYAILTYRYLDGLTIEEIAAKLNLSRRQAYREHAKGIEAVASLLWEETCSQEHSVSGEESPDRLAAARAEVNRLSTHSLREQITLSEVLESTLALLSPRIEASHIRIVIAERLEPEPLILADRTVLRQALLTVLSYALDEAVHDELLIVYGHERQQVVLTIRESVQERPLLHGTDSQTRVGVGLTVAQQLVEGQGGSLDVNRREGCWQAEFRLPTVGPKTVLVVDDNEGLVSLFQRYAGAHQVMLLSATTAEQALSLAEELRPNAILLDLMLPNQDGWDILAQLQARDATREIPVIICSVLNEVQLAQAMGAKDYITKPVTQASLLEVLQRWLGTLHLAA